MPFNHEPGYSDRCAKHVELRGGLYRISRLPSEDELRGAAPAEIAREVALVTDPPSHVIIAASARSDVQKFLATAARCMALGLLGAMV